MGQSEAAHSSAEDASGGGEFDRAGGEGEFDRAGGEEEFDPIGTLTLIGIYFAILLLGWVYIYFIEFLGRDLVVIG